MRAHVEREIKLAATPEFSLARLPAQAGKFALAAPVFHRLHTVYYDTPERRLARWGCSLRYRYGAGWTLKVPAGEPSPGDAHVRTEYEFAGTAGTIPPEALELATAYVRRSPVRRDVELRTVRITRAVRAGGDGPVVAELAEDDVRVVEDARTVRRFKQLEIELQDGAAPKTLRAIARALRRLGAGRYDPLAKNVRALGDDCVAPEIETVDAGSAHATSGDVFRAAFAAAVCVLIRVDVKLRAAPDEAEPLHDARVAARKMRSHLKTFRSVLDPAWTRALRDKLDWLNDRLAGARDLDALIEALERRSETLPAADYAHAGPLLEELRSTRTARHGAVQQSLRDGLYVALLDELVEAAARPHVRPRARRRASAAAGGLLRRVWKRLRKATPGGRTVPSNRRLHAVRIAAKHVRYAAEALAPVGGKRLRALARRARTLQDVLGEQHDAVVAMDRLRAMAADPVNAFVAGELTELSDAAARAVRTSWRKHLRRLARSYEDAERALAGL